MINRKLSERLFNIFNILLMIALMIITIYPFWNQFLISFAAKKDVYSVKPLWYPRSFDFSSYKAIINYTMLWRGYLNTIIRTTLGTVLSLLVTSMTAYPLTKKELPFNKTFTFLILFTMLFGGGLIPSFLLITNTLKLTNSIWALILPGLAGAFNVFIMRNFFKTLPAELEESARIDGASQMRIFMQIILPLSTPVLVTVGLWIGVGHWQAWYDYLLYIPDPNKWGLPMILREVLIINRPQSAMQAVQQTFGSANAVDPRQLNSAIIIVSVLPMLIIYPFLQKFLAKGIMLGAVKG